jgi:hypothetical protein
MIKWKKWKINLKSWSIQIHYLNSKNPQDYSIGLTLAFLWVNIKYHSKLVNAWRKLLRKSLFGKLQR